MSGRNRMPRDPPRDGPLPVLHRGRPPHPVALEEELELQHRDIRRIVAENGQVVEENVILQRELTAVKDEIHRLAQIIPKVHAEKDARTRDLIDRGTKLETELRETEPLKADVGQLRAEAQKLNSLRKELSGQLQTLTKDTNRLKAENEQVVALKADIDGMRKDLMEMRRDYEMMKKTNEEHMIQNEAMEKDLISMAREVEKLRGEQTRTRGLGMDDIDFQEDLHPLLRFDSPERRTRFLGMRGREIISVSTLSWGAMHTLRIAQRMQSLLFHGPQSPARPPAFLRLLDIDEPVYYELTMEFLATINFVATCTDYSRDDMISFRLGGVERSLSLRQFAAATSIYLPEEIADPSFDTAAIPRARLDRSDKATIWEHLAPDAGPYSAHNSKATSFRDPTHRLLFRVIASSIACRREPGTVAVRDLELLRLFLDTDLTIQFAYILAQFFSTAYGLKTANPILGGMYITRLARGLGVLDDADLVARMSLVPTAARQTIGLEMLESMKMLTADRRHLMGYPVAKGPQVPISDPIPDPVHPPSPPPVHSPPSPPCPDHGASTSHASPPHPHPEASSSHSHSPPSPPYHFTSASDPGLRALARELLDIRRALAWLTPAAISPISPHIIIDPPTPQPSPHQSPPRPNPTPSTSTALIEASPSPLIYRRRTRQRRDPPTPPADA